MEALSAVTPLFSIAAEYAWTCHPLRANQALRRFGVLQPLIYTTTS